MSASVEDMMQMAKFLELLGNAVDETKVEINSLYVFRGGLSGYITPCPTEGTKTSFTLYSD